MFEEYEDMFSEPSRADEIIDTAITDLRGLITDSFTAKIKEAANAEKSLNSLNQEIKLKENQLIDINRQITEAKKKAEDSEKNEIPRVYIQKFVKKAIGNYAPGDKVWVICDKGRYEKCPTCEGKKEVAVLIKGISRSVKCPDCSCGERFVSNLVVEERKITRIDLKLCFFEKRVSYWDLDCISINDPSNGTSLRISLDKIFPTKEQAELRISEILKTQE